MNFFQKRNYHIPYETEIRFGWVLWLFGAFVYGFTFWKLETANRAGGLTGFYYILGFLIVSLSYLCLCFLRVSKKTENISFLSGIALRFLLIFFLPIFEDDWARYLWDGFQTFAYGSPYGLKPEAFFQDSNPVHAEILSRINHPDWPTIYGPVLEIYFFLIHIIFPWKLASLKFFLFLPDLLLFVLIRKEYGRKSGMAYWWNPVLLKEVFLNAHPDILGISILFLAFVLVRKKSFRTGFFFWGTSLAAKGFGILLLPFLFFESIRKKIGFRTSLESIGFAILGFGFPYSVFLLFSLETDLGVAAKFAGDFEFFPLGYSILKYAFGEFSRIVWIGFSAGIAIVFFGKRSSYHLRLEERISIPLFLFFFFSPVLNAWYLLWILPFLFPFRRSFWPGWCILFASQISYLNYANLGEWNFVLEKGYYSHPVWVVELAVFAILSSIFLWIRRFSRGRNSF